MTDATHQEQSGLDPTGAESDPRKPAAGPPDPCSTAALQAELDDAQEKLMRALAEQQNIRRQMQRQCEEALKFAASQVMEDLIDTLDNLRRAIGSVRPETLDDAIKPLLKGVEATEGNLLATLARHGLQRVDPLGSPFNPHYHHAIAQRFDANGPDGTVVEVMQPGYLLNGRVLRPAMVSVAAREPGEDAQVHD